MGKIICALLLIVISLMLMAAKCHHESHTDYSCKFHNGQKVKSVVDDRLKGQIIESYDWYRRFDLKYMAYTVQHCTYDVRFITPSVKTNTRVFSEDGPVQFFVLSDIHMREYELRGMKE